MEPELARDSKLFEDFIDRLRRDPDEYNKHFGKYIYVARGEVLIGTAEDVRNRIENLNNPPGFLCRVDEIFEGEVEWNINLNSPKRRINAEIN